MSTEISVIKKKFSDSELKLINELTKPGTIVEVLLPETMDAKEWKANTSTICRAYVKAELQERVLLPVIGKLLVFAKAHKDAIWSDYETWEAFMTDEVYAKFGIGRSTAYEAVAMAGRLPHLSIGELEAIPRRNLKIALQAIPKGDEKKAAAKTVLQKAAEMPESEFREFCEAKGYIGPGEVQGAFIRIGCSKKVLKAWEKFVADPQIHAVCGTENAGDILFSMIEECMSWKATAEDAAEAADAAVA